MFDSIPSRPVLNLGICASPRWPPFTDAILEVVRTGWQTGLWHCLHGFNPHSALHQWVREKKTFAVILGALMDEEMVFLARQQANRVLSFSSCLPPDERIWQVLFDPVAIGRAAAEHLRKQGVVAAVVYQPATHWGLQRRGEVFAEAMHEAGIPVWGTFRTLESLPLDQIRRADGAVGFFAPDDEYANPLSCALVEANIAIPYQAMVLGVNDQEYLCHFGPIPLSSVRLDGAAMGKACVSLLQEWATDPDASRIPRIEWIPPLGVTVRASTSGEVLGDSLVSRALQALRHDDELPRTVEAWAVRVGSSRRPLEKRLRRVFTQSPKQMLDAERIRRAVYALRNTRQDMETIASRAGFSSGRHLRETLQRVLDQTPSEIRFALTSPALEDLPDAFE